MLNASERMFDMEFILKQKAQLKYIQTKQSKRIERLPLMNALSHEYLWSPTPIYYVGTFAFYMFFKKKLHLTKIGLIPMLIIPATLDYIKREYYVGMFPKEKKLWIYSHIFWKPIPSPVNSDEFPTYTTHVL